MEIYLIHFNKPYRHAKHYLGKTTIGHRQRTKRHFCDPGPLIKAAKNNGSSFVVSRVWKDAANDYERKLKKRGGSSQYCPYCKRGNMGQYLSVKRRTLKNCNRGCKWCGTKKSRMYEYNGDGPFCNKDCCKTFWGTWPYQIAFGQDLPIEYVR